MDRQPPIVRDFLGLGKLVTDDQGPEEGTPVKPCFLPFQGHHAPSTTLDLAGVKHPVCNLGLSMEHNFPSRKISKEIYMEGSDGNYGLARARQWPGMMRGTNATVGGPPARVFASDAHTKSNATQLTIVYGGHVNVYNNVGAEKAQAIMDMAAASSNEPSLLPVLRAGGFCQPAGVAENFCFNAQTLPAQFRADQASQNDPPAANEQFECSTPLSASSPQPVVPRALPLARKASLARFLEKRKERIQMMMPYYKKQLPAQGDQRLGPFHGATLAQLYEEFYRKPSTMVFGMQENITSHNDVLSCSSCAKQ